MKSSTTHAFAGEWLTRQTAQRTIPFPDQTGLSFIALRPSQAQLARSGRLCTLHVEDGCLEAVGIYPGDEIICKSIESSEEIDPRKIYLIKITVGDDEEIVAGRVRYAAEDCVSLRLVDGTNLAVFCSEIEIKESLYVLRSADGRGHFGRDVSPFHLARNWSGESFKIAVQLRELARVNE